MNTTKNLIVPTFKVEAAYALGGWSRIVIAAELMNTVLAGIEASPVGEVRVVQWTQQS